MTANREVFEGFISGYKSDIINSISKMPNDKVYQAAEIINEAIENKNYIFLIGNGGSAATPSHSAGDFSKELGAKTFCLTDNVAAITAWSNDESYDSIFVNQLKVYLNPGDIIIAYSGSGNSPNVINALKYANGKGITTIGITGNYKNKGEGKIGKYTNLCISFETESMEIIEDLELVFNHIVKEYIKILQQ